MTQSHVDSGRARRAVALLIVAVAVVLVVPPRRRRRGRGRAGASTNSGGDRPCDDAAVAAATKPKPPTTRYLDVVRAYPRLAATQPLGLPLNLPDAARSPCCTSRSTFVPRATCGSRTRGPARRGRGRSRPRRAATGSSRSKRATRWRTSTGSRPEEAPGSSRSSAASATAGTTSSSPPAARRCRRARTGGDQRDRMERRGDRPHRHRRRGPALLAGVQGGVPRFLRPVRRNPAGDGLATGPTAGEMGTGEMGTGDVATGDTSRRRRRGERAGARAGDEQASNE